ncbi:hypothetical protein K5D51_13695 [Pseudomonas cichorii]|nr:hypothetical protein [Pseudomonas cichorii]MBX8580621.1 hypothetical protein [Pseudomonas cichorii]
MSKTVEVEFLTPSKLFFEWLVEVMGQKAWLKRREKLVLKIRTIEEQCHVSDEPIEWQLYSPSLEDQIVWYMFLIDVLNKEPFSDDPFESQRIYAIFASIGDQVDKLKLVPEVERVMRKLVSFKRNSPDNDLFEILVAAHYLRNGYDVSFVEEASPLKTPDLLVSKSGVEIFVECKRLEKITRYSKSEILAWEVLWEKVSIEMLRGESFCWLEMFFHVHPSEVEPELIIAAYHNVSSGAHKTGRYSCSQFELMVNSINRDAVVEHFANNRVRVNSPQVELLVFGDVNPNEKRSFATIPTRIVREGHGDGVLNIFMDGIEKCVGGQWSCMYSESIDKRSIHFKSKAKEAAEQIPNGALGIVHVLYETSEGPSVEVVRREKLISAFTNFRVEGKNIMGVFVHGIHVYPHVEGFEWAETVQEFTIIPGLVNDLYKSILLLGFDKVVSAKNETHWDQDNAHK